MSKISVDESLEVVMSLETYNRLKETIMKLTRKNSQLEAKVESLDEALQSSMAREEESSALRRKALNDLHQVRAENRRLLAANESLDKALNDHLRKDHQDLRDTKSLKEKQYDKAVRDAVDKMSHDEKVVYNSLTDLVNSLIKDGYGLMNL